MAEPEGAFRLTFVEGRGLLTLAGRDIPELGRVERLELEIPNLRFPVDVSGGLARFKNRRLRLRQMVISLGAPDLARVLRAGRLAEFGILDPRVEIEDGLIRLMARAVVGEHEAEFTALAGVTLSQPARARLVIFDVRLFGFLPVPAPSLATALCAALGATRREDGQAEPAPLPALLRLQGLADLDVDLLELALLAVLPMSGWRLPERQDVRAGTMAGGQHSDRLTLSFTDSPEEGAAEIALQDRLATHAALSARFAGAESALLAGDVRAASEAYRQASPDDRLATERLLWLLASAAGTLPEAEALAGAALARWPDCAAAFLVQAMAAAERGLWADAALLYERFGERARREGDLSDYACACWAAARLWVRADNESRALLDLDAALASRRLSAAVRALARRRAEEGRWDEVTPLLARGSNHTEMEPGDDDARAAIELSELAVISRDPELCGRAVAALDALLSRESWPDPEVSRAEAARQMALLSETLGDVQTAIEWLRDCLEAEVPGRVASLAWRELVQLLASRKDDEATANTLRAWAEDERTGESALQRSRHLCASARLLHEHLGREGEAMAAVESALRLVPGDHEALGLAESLAEATGNWSGLADLLRHRLGEVRPEEGKSLLLRLAGVLGGRLGQIDDAVQSYRLLLDLEASDLQARLGLARLLWSAGRQSESAAEYRELLTSPCPAEIAGEAHLRLAQWAQGDDQGEAARQALAAALIVDLSQVSLPALMEALRTIRDGGELASSLAGREAELPPEQRLDFAHARAAAFSRCGRRAEAEAAYCRILEQAPGDERALAWFAEDQGSSPAAPNTEHGEPGETRSLSEGAPGRTAEGVTLEASEPAAAGPPAPAEPSSNSTPISVELAVAELEQLLAEHPADAATAEMLFQAYGRIAEPQARDGARAALVERVPGLPAWCHAAVHLASAVDAEGAGQIELAEQELSQAFALDESPSARASQLALRARLHVARDQIAEAEADLEQALALAPQDAGALATAAELAYRGQDWERARSLYAKLALMSDADRVADRSLLAFRRAELAEMFGDHAEAERAFEEAVHLDPSHAGAHEALAGLALLRGDLTVAVAHFEEALRLLPRDAIVRLTEVRQRLGETYLALDQLAPARQNLEMALASEPGNVASLELLVTTYERMGLHRDAASSCERLARLLPEPTNKAQALFREGEILRALGDGEAANDAFLRASDLDPTFGPTLERLVLYYWDRGDWANLREVGRDFLASQGRRGAGQHDLPLLIALGAVVLGADAEAARVPIQGMGLQGMGLDAAILATRLGEMARHMARAGELPEPVLTFVLEGRPASFETELCAAALRAVLGDPADLGPVILLAQLLERRGDKGRARAARDLALFLDPDLVLGGRLAELESESATAPGSFAAGAADHPLCRGPLRRVLRALSPALAAVPQSALEPSRGEAPSAKAIEIFDELRSQLQAPVMGLMVHGDGAEITFATAQPLSVVVGRRAQTLAVAELRFLLARAFEQARAGTLAVVRMSPGDLRSLLRGIIRAVSVHPSDRLDQDEEGVAAAGWAERLAAVTRLMPMGKESADVLVDAGDTLSRPPDLDGYLRGCRFTADRVGLLVCGSPIVALRALSGAFKASRPSQPENLASQRQEQVRSSSALRELISFMLSEEYAALLS